MHHDTDTHMPTISTELFAFSLNPFLVDLQEFFTVCAPGLGRKVSIQVLWVACQELFCMSVHTAADGAEK